MKKLLLTLFLCIGIAGISQADGGKALYNQVCSVCHADGLAGAPKFGNKADWTPRLADGFDAMVTIAINGKGAMPPKGGTDADDKTIRAAIKYMLEQSHVKGI